MPSGTAWVKPKADLEGVNQSHLENLRWAVEAAGQFDRTNREPKTCPNDMAWFLFVQAKENPKELLAKLNLLEAKQLENIQENERIITKRTVEQIDQMLEELEDAEFESRLEAS